MTNEQLIAAVKSFLFRLRVETEAADDEMDELELTFYADYHGLAF
jgi:hypothetical protein